MFRNARALNGVFSTIVNFTVSDFLRGSQKLSIFNQLKYEQIDNYNGKTLRFPVHYTHKTDDIKAIDKKLDDIEHYIIAKKNNTLEMNILSQYIYNNLKEKSRLVDDTTVPPSDFNQSHDLEWEIDDSDDNDDDNSDIDAQIFNELLDVDDEEQNITSVKTEFQGINIRDHIDSDDIKSYFKIQINNKIKYMYKQSACWLLTEENTQSSTDRLSRVMQASRNKI
ncbi:unnamed protein product [Rotaria sp. Silwood2]|nr:unnamed protein product [Rotaria sp. Silwood2]CAF4490417.1 unnamed protein product [Rotaria sp. Silwood2]CAF4511689.1 unnamed protein product [Rotaria sp. Silwood2]